MHVNDATCYKHISSEPGHNRNPREQKCAISIPVNLILSTALTFPVFIVSLTSISELKRKV